MLSYLGLFNLVFMVMGLYMLTVRSKRHDLLRRPISDLAGYKKTKDGFRNLLIAFALLQVVFAVIVLGELNPDSRYIIIVSFLIGATALSFAGEISSKQNFSLHRRLVELSVAAVSSGVVLLSLALLDEDLHLGISLISLTIFLSLLSLSLRKDKAGYWELPVLVLVMIWNVFFTIAIT